MNINCSPIISRRFPLENSQNPPKNESGITWIKKEELLKKLCYSNGKEELSDIVNWYFVIFKTEELYNFFYQFIIESTLPVQKKNILNLCYKLTLHPRMSKDELVKKKVKTVLIKIYEHLKKEKIQLENHKEQLRQQSSLLYLRYNHNMDSRAGTEISPLPIKADYLQKLKLDPFLQGQHDFKELIASLISLDISVLQGLLNLDPTQSESSLSSPQNKAIALVNDILSLQRYLLSYLTPFEVNKKIEPTNKTNHYQSIIANINTRLTMFAVETVLESKTPAQLLNALYVFHILNDCLFRRNDFQSGVSLHGAFSHSLIGRLKATRDIFHKDAKFVIYDELVSNRANYIKAREMFRKLEQSSNPFIPILGIFFHDINTLKEIEIVKSIDKQTNINVYSLKMLNDSMNKLFSSFKDFPMRPLRTNLFATLLQLDVSAEREDVLYKRSCEIEPSLVVVSRSF